MKIRHKLIPAAYILLFKENKVLLQRRMNTGYKDGEYGVPAGHVEEGETIKEALIREIREEIGINIDLNDIKFVYISNRMIVDNERIDFFFTTDKWENEIVNNEPEKCDELDWFDVDNLPDNTISYIRKAIEASLKNVFYQEFKNED